MAVFATGNHRSPLTNELLPSSQLTPNRQLKKLCDAYRVSISSVGERKRTRFETATPPMESVSRVLDELRGAASSS